jgi:hypothetical protein
MLWPARQDDTVSLCRHCIQSACLASGVHAALPRRRHSVSDARHCCLPSDEVNTNAHHQVHGMPCTHPAPSRGRSHGCPWTAWRRPCSRSWRPRGCTGCLCNNTLCQDCWMSVWTAVHWSSSYQHEWRLACRCAVPRQSYASCIRALRRKQDVKSKCSCVGTCMHQAAARLGTHRCRRIRRHHRCRSSGHWCWRSGEPPGPRPGAPRPPSAPAAARSPC